MRLKLCKSIFEGFFGRNSIEERKKILIISTIIAFQYIDENNADTEQKHDEKAHKCHTDSPVVFG